MCEISEYYGIPVSSSLAKKELKAVLLGGLVSNGVFLLAAVSSGEGRADPQVGEAAEQQSVSFTPGVMSGDMEGKPFTLPPFDPLSVESSPGSILDAKLKVNLALLQLEKDDREREFQVVSYFDAFELFATALHRPEDVWSILLLCKLTGKAQEPCSFLSVEDSLVYEKVEGTILQAYELVPEAYRQRF